jgi:hypothetical protein
LLHVPTEPSEHWSFRLAWSTFRRRHQATAKRCHAARRHASDPPPVGNPSMHILPRPRLELTDERWDRIAAVLPPSSAHGRPPQDHRPLLEGILWVMQTGAAWREFPERFGHWHTVYTRYRDWHRAGLWPKMLKILQSQVATDAS